MRVERILLACLAVLGAFIAFEARSTRTPNEDTSQRAAATPSPSPGSNEVVVASSGTAAPVRDLTYMRRRIAGQRHGTFIDEILAARDSNLARWAERDRAVLVWIDERTPLASPNQDLGANVRRAFTDWSAAGLPLSFSFVGDSSRADVVVTFLERFTTAVSGRTVWTRDQHWWILRGEIALALQHPTGAPYADDEIHAIALHEVGHLLGLDHTANAQAIMSPKVSVLQLAPEDIATMRLIYTLPPGAVRGN